MSNKRKEIIKEKYLEGKLVTEIVKELNISQPTVSKYIKQLKEEGEIPKDLNNKPKSSKTQKRKEIIKEKYLEGELVTKIAKELNMNQPTVSRYIKKLKEEGEIPKDFNNRQRSSKIQKRKEIIKEKYLEGKAITEIAEELNISQATVSKDIKKLKEEGEIPKNLNNKPKSSKIQKRKEIIKEKYLEGKSVTEIVKELNISKATVSKDIKKLKEEGEIPKDLNNRQRSSKTQKRKEIIKEKYLEGKSVTEIVKELNISKVTVSKYIKKLKEEGEIPEDLNNKPKSSKTQKRKKIRKEIIKEKYLEGKSVTEIVEELNISKATVYRHINQLKESGKIQERKERIKEKYLEGKTITKIAEELNISQSTVSKYIKKLKEEGEIPKDLNDRQKRKEIVKEKYLEGKSITKIAKELNMNQPTVSRYIKKLKEEGEIPKDFNKQARSRKIQERNEIIKEKYLEGKSTTKIAKELNISQSTVCQHINQLKESGEIKERKEIVKEKYLEGKSITEIVEELNIHKTTVYKYIRQLKESEEIPKDFNNQSRRKRIQERKEKGKLKKNENARFKRIIEYIKKCNGSEGAQQAIDYAKSYQNSKYLNEEQRGILKRFIKASEIAQKKAIIKLRKEGRTNEEIYKITRYAEGIIAETVRKYDSEVAMNMEK